MLNRGKLEIPAQLYLWRREMTDREKESSYEHYKQWQLNKTRYRAECVAYVLLFGLGFLFIIEHLETVFIVLGIVLMVGTILLSGRIVQKWNRKKEALKALKKMAEEMGAKDIEIDCEKGEISFEASSEIMDKNILAVEQALLSRGLKAQVKRIKREEQESNMSNDRNRKSKLNYTEIGYVNANNQRNNGKTNKRGTDNNQFFYTMECLNCGHTYYANGSDIWQRKCPMCQGGKP